MNLFKTLDYKVRFARDNPDYFYPAGIWCFCGPQGSGKTLSAVLTLKEMLKEYPKAMVCSNLAISGLDRPVIPFTDYKQLEELSNGIYGIIFLIDEIHVLWNSLESKDIPISEMACFCQMRKDRRVILGTSQKYNRVAKPIREQLQYVITCDNYFGLLQSNTVIDPNEGEEKDGKLEGQIVAHQYWFHFPELYNSYDTLFKINKPKREALPPKGGTKKYGK
ncbi:MAG: ATP-binding protein [Bacteroides sp.]|nr:ATP-binding protein [Bacteroides sp.]